MVRCKFKVDNVSHSMTSVKNLETGQYEQKPATTLCLTPVYSGSPENDRFYAATPSGRVDLSVIRGEAAEMFEIGKEYYVDFTPAK